MREKQKTQWSGFSSVKWELRISSMDIKNADSKPPGLCFPWHSASSSPFRKGLGGNLALC